MDNIEITGIRVKHALRERTFPTMGFFFRLPNKTTILWCEDIAEIPPKSMPYFKKAQIIFLDCAMPGSKGSPPKSIFNHFSYDNILELVPRLSAKKIYLVQLGKLIKYQEILKWLKEDKLYPRVIPSFDNMRINI